MSAMTEQEPAQMLEERIIDLLCTFCETSAKNQDARVPRDPDAPEGLSPKAKQKLNVLAQNLAYLIRNWESPHGKQVGAADIFMPLFSWEDYKDGRNTATLAVMVRTTTMREVLRVYVRPNEDILQKLSQVVDLTLTGALEQRY